jgi:hypothetical protein
MSDLLITLELPNLKPVTVADYPKLPPDGTPWQIALHNDHSFGTLKQMRDAYDKGQTLRDLRLVEVTESRKPITTTFDAYILNMVQSADRSRWFVTIRTTQPKTFNPNQTPSLIPL